MKPLPIYFRDQELEELRHLVSRRRSFLLCGLAGVGKTLLLKRLAIEVPQMLYCGVSTSSQTVFRILAAELFAKENRRLVKTFGINGLHALKDKSAVSLRGIVTDALQEGRHLIVLDHVQSPSQPYANALKDLCGRAETPLIAVARSAHMEDVGFLLPLFPERSAKFTLRNFDSDTAKQFALQVGSVIHLQAANYAEVIEKIVHLSKGNPGAILTMLEMAASPKYVADRHIKISPLYIDFRLSCGATHG